MPAPRGAEVWRDYVTDGVPSSGRNDPAKADARAWSTWLESLVTSGVLSSGPWFATMESMTLGYDANTVAVVYDDPDAAENGLYIKVGASGSGSWSQITTFLPGYQFVTASPTETSTANAIVATTSPRLPAGDGVALVTLPVPHTNTAAAVTVAFDGGAALTIKTRTGEDPAIGELQEGDMLAGFVSGSTFRLIIDPNALIYAQRAEAAQAGAEAARDIAAGFASDIVAQGNVPIFDSRDTAATYDLSAFSVVRINRFGAGLIVAPATYEAVGAEPAHAGKFQSADGKWWSLKELIPSATMFGAALDGITDDTQAYRDFFAFITETGTQVADLGSGVAKCSKVLHLPPITYVGGSITFDFSAVDDDAEFPDNVCLDCVGSAPVALPPLAADPVEGGYQLTFSEAPDLEPDDLICIFNPTDYSLNGYRPYYKAGDRPRVLDVSGATVSLVAPLDAGYSAAAVGVHKYGDDRVVFAGGRLRVRASQSVLYGVRFWRLQRSIFDRLDVFGSKDTEIQWYECVDCVGRGIETGKDGLILTSYYGGYVANCQGMRLEGNWRGGRHGITLTGTGDENFITPPTRDIQVFGEYWNMPNTSDAYHSFNTHGNVLGYHASGIFHNGVALGGNKGRISGRIETFGDNDFGAVAFLEQHGTDHTVDADIYTLANPNNKSRGVIDIGGNSDAITDDTVKGGFYRFRGTLHAPNAGRLFRMRNRGATGLKIGVDLSGLKIAEAAGSGSSTSVQADAVSGDVISELDLAGFKMPDGHGWGVDTVTRIYGWRQSIKTSVDTTTDVSTVSKSTTINAPKIPCVSASIGDASPGGKPDAAIAFNGGTLSRTNVTFILASASGNFVSAETVPVHLSLLVDE